jgi:general secretion pathway protein A
MYRKHFNLEKKPFQISSDNQFLWLGKKHASALELLKQGIAQKKGLLVLTGDVGTGKTTLINEIVHSLDAKTQSVIIADSSFEMHHIFLTIARAFGFENQYQKEKKFSAEFVSFLRTANTMGRKVLVIVDEAQRIPGRFLKEIISWSEFRLNRVLTVILAGQLEFHNILGIHLGQDWRNHIKTHAFLEPLDENETKLYINKRLELAGSKRNIFLVSAIHEVHVYSKGFPRLINIACDQAFIAAFAKGVRLVDVPTFKQALGQIDLPITPSGEKNAHPKETIPFQGSWIQRKFLIGGAAVFLICLFAGYLNYGENAPSAFKKESLAPPGLISLENQPQKPKLPAASESLPGVKKAIKTVSLIVSQQEPADQHIDAAYTPAFPMEEKEDPSPVLINNPMEIDQTAEIKRAAPKDIEGFVKEVFSFKGKFDSVNSEGAMALGQVKEKPLPGPAEPFEENSVDDYLDGLNAPEPDAIIDWLIHKRETQ